MRYGNVMGWQLRCQCVPNLAMRFVMLPMQRGVWSVEVAEVHPKLRNVAQHFGEMDGRIIALRRLAAKGKFKFRHATSVDCMPAARQWNTKTVANEQSV